MNDPREALASRLEESFKDTSFGMENPVKINHGYWADLAIATGNGFEWAADWIQRGYPNPPEWIVRYVLRKIDYNAS